MAQGPLSANPPPEGGANGTGNPRTISQELTDPLIDRTLGEKFLIVVVFVFGIVVFWVEAWTIKMLRDRLETDPFRIYSTTLIIIGALVFIVGAYDATKNAPVLGLFGTIAGYILGRTSTPRPQSTQPPAATPNL